MIEADLGREGWLGRRDVFAGVLLGRPRVVWLIAFLVGLFLALIGPGAAPEQWVGWLPTTATCVESQAAWLAMLSSSLSALVAGQARTHGLAEWVESSPRSPRQRALVPPSFGFSAVAAAISVAMAVALVWSWRNGLRGGLVAPLTVLAVPTLLCYCAFWAGVGAALGRRLPRAIALPVGAIGPYAAFAIVSYYLDGGPLGVFAVGDGRSYDYVRLSDGSLLLRAGFWLLATVLVWSHASAAECREKSGLGARTLPWAVSAAAAVAILQGAVYVPIAGAIEPICGGAAPRTCLDRSHATAMGRYRAAVRAAWNDLPAPMRPVGIGASVGDLTPLGAEEGSFGTATDPSLVVAPPIRRYTNPARVVDQREFVAELGDALFLSRCGSGSRGFRAALVVAAWWRLSHDIPLDRAAYVGDPDPWSQTRDVDRVVASARRFEAMSQASRTGWFERHHDQVLTCSVTTDSMVG